MQLLLMALILGLFLYDTVAMTGPPMFNGPLIVSIVLIPKGFLALAYALQGRATYRQLRGPGAAQTLRRMDRATSIYRLFVLGLFVLDLWCGALDVIRETLGNLVLIDEAILLVPTLAMLVWAWWVFYPIDRRLREAALIRELDSGHAFKPIRSRWSYVGAHVRHEVALVGLPLLLILAWYEAVPRLFADWPSSVQTSAQLVGSAAVFLLAPLMIRYVWDTVAMPAGDMREHLQTLCDQHHVKVRDILLWRTHSNMINAAVMGLIAPLRYILLTESLLERMPRPQVEAVMAHELGHVRKKHMLWLLASALAALGMIERGAAALEPLLFPDVTSDESSILTALLAIGGLVVWAGAFGWISRRFERQADTFAVQHLVAQRDPGSQATIDAASARLMIETLQQVATLNHTNPAKSNWRHGSIAWRQAYLQSLVGQRVRELSIDQQMRWIQGISLAALAWLLVEQLFLA